MSPTELVTEPPPPSLVTVSVQLGRAANVAVTSCAAVMATVHWLPAKEVHPAQDSSVWPVSGVAVRTTSSPSVNGAWHVSVSRQSLIPVGLLFTAPDPRTLTV